MKSRDWQGFRHGFRRGEEAIGIQGTVFVEEPESEGRKILAHRAQKPGKVTSGGRVLTALSRALTGCSRVLTGLTQDFAEWVGGVWDGKRTARVGRRRAVMATSAVLAPLITVNTVAPGVGVHP